MSDVKYHNRQKWIESIFGEPMKPCPKCDSYELNYQTPIKMNVPEDYTPQEMLMEWLNNPNSRTNKLEGPCFIMCWDCGHRGPAVDCSGKTLEDVSDNPEINKKMINLWNNQ